MLLFYHFGRLFYRNTNKMGRRSTALPPEKSKSLYILCGDAWDVSFFCICTPPCSLSSVSFLCRKPGRESCRLPVQGQQPVEIRVERLYPLMVLFSDFITHTRLILGYTLFLKFSQMVLPFQRASFRLSSTLPTIRSTSSGR